MASIRASKAPKVFIDSSVLIAAAISERGSARDLILAGLRGEFTLCTSPLVLEETERNLWRKAPAAVPAYDAFRQALAANLVQPGKTLLLRAAKVVELKDAPIVAGAIRARAPYLATYDRKHLLNHREPIKAHFGVTVAFPGEVLRQQEGGGSL